MLLLLAVEVQRVLDLLAEAFALGRLAVAAVLLLVDVASSTTLLVRQPCALFCTFLPNLRQCGTRPGSRER